MFALTWKEIQTNGNQPIHLKSFRTEDARTDFIDTLYDSGQRFEITSTNTAGDPMLEDFFPACGYAFPNPCTQDLSAKPEQ